MKTKMKCRAESYFGPWSILEDVFNKYVGVVKGLDLAALAEKNVKADSPSSPLPTENPDEEDDDSFASYELNGTSAVIDLSGPLTKYPTSFQAIFGGTSMVLTQYAIRQANADPEVKSICLRIDSPGGTCAGTYELAQEVANSAKPVYAYVQDCGCSAAYWIASQCALVACNPIAMVGSIGTLLVLQDTSGAYQQEGVKVLALGTGKYKGAGTDGTPITDEQVNYFLGIANEINTHFLAAVTDKRKLNSDQLDSVKTASVFIGSKAVDMGLVDEVMSFESFIESIQEPTGDNEMDSEAMKVEIEKATKDSQVKAVDRMKTILALCDNDHLFANEQFLAGASDTEVIAALNKKLKTQLADAKTKINSDSDGHPGVMLSASTDDVQKEFMAIVDKNVKTGMKRPEAMKAAIAKNPKLYEEWKETFATVQVKKSK